MNLRFVEAFYWVVALKSVTRAAEKLFLTQSAVSSRIAVLERELGTLLLDRRDKQFRLTLAGKRFYGYAEKLLDLQAEIKLEMGSGRAMQVSLRIGAIESVLHSWLVPWLKILRQQFPDLALELSVDTTPTLHEQILRGAQDLVFTASPAGGEGVVNKFLTSMEMVFVGNRQQHRRRTYTAEQLLQHELLTFQRGSQPHVDLIEKFRQLGDRPNRIHTISSISAMAQLVQGGFGVATLPREVIMNRLNFPQLKRLETVAEMGLEPLPIYAGYREDPTSRAVEVLVSSAQHFLKSD